ncbi:MAG: Nif3-like dinuclear metal center hexameric protein [Bacteroidales bacterium]|nr:Nif3-like dinuclear metal center hexameric protein [Bacteroidales bacterium]MBD5273031.1 Nif3-like dinuclear metal center hexameric protein [Bacteroides sp.]MDE6257434.1 Nif3-like dinuclear metal center hexameric protein [Muribaculaceae bacterium]
MTKVRDISNAIENFAPIRLQEDYDNAGLQVGDPDMEVSAVLLCLDVTEEILQEAIERSCNMIISHHPLIFRGLKNVTGKDPIQRIVIEALRNNVAIYSAHTNLDSAREGVSHEIGNILNLSDMKVLDPKPDDPSVGIGVIGDMKPTPKLEFLRRLKEKFNVKALKYSAHSPKLVIKRPAVCGGSGAFLIKKAIEEGADAIVTGDVKYHDFTSFGDDILIADIGHYESELCSSKIFSRIIRDRFPEMVVYFAEKESNPIAFL